MHAVEDVRGKLDPETKHPGGELIADCPFDVRSQCASVALGIAIRNLQRDQLPEPSAERRK